MSDIVNVVDPDGNLTGIDASQAQQALDQGYTQASDQDIHNYQTQQKYGTPGEQLKAGLEGAASAATFGLSTKMERQLGVKPEDIQGRAEANPGSHSLGQIAGLAASNLIPGYGEAVDADAANAASQVNPFSAQQVISHAGQKGAEALGFAGNTALSKIGQTATKYAIENALVQSGDEVSKMFSDPDQTVGNAAADIGLAGLLGGGLGAGVGSVGELWKSSKGVKLGGFLDNFKSRVNGEPVSLPADLQQASDVSGLQLAPEQVAALSGSPELKNSYQMVQEAQNSSGVNLRENISKLHNQASDLALQALGKTENDIPTLGETSKYELGSQLQDQIGKSIDEKISPIADKFNQIKEQFKSVPIDDAVKGNISEKLGNLAQTERYTLDPDSAQNKFVQNAIKVVNNAKDLEDLRAIQSNLTKSSFDPLNTKGLNDVGSKVSKVLRGTEDDLVEQMASAKSPLAVDDIKQARMAYGNARDILDQLNDRLHVGSYGGPKSFINGLKEMAPEQVMNRLSKPNDAGLISLLQKEFPEVSSAIRDNQLKEVLAKAGARAKGESSLNLKVLNDSLAKMSPEMRSSILPEGAEAKIQGLNKILSSLPERINPSGTAGTVSRMMSKVPSSVMAAVSWLTGHSPLVGMLAGKGAEWLGHDAPDAMRLSMLKYLGKEGATEPGAFKALFDLTHSSIRGEGLINKAVSGLVKGSREVLLNKAATDKDRAKLDNHVKSSGSDNAQLMNKFDDHAYYSPEHAQALAKTSVRALNYLNTLRPSTAKIGVLNGNRVPSSLETMRYNRALDIASNPLSVLEDARKGSLTSQDVMDLNSMYPDLHDKINQKLVTEMSNHVGTQNNIPYQTRLGLSLLMGQHLDQSLSPQNIQASMMSSSSTPQSQNQPMPKQAKPLNQGKSLTKMASLESTPLQNRNMNKSMQS